PEITAALGKENRLAAFALASDDLDSDIAAVRARGLEIEGPLEGERLRPDGVRVAWRTAVPVDPRLPFIIQDVTPRAQRIPLPTVGIGQTLYINDVNVGVKDIPTDA